MGENNKQKEMGNRFYRGLIFFIPLLYSIQTRFLRRTKLGLIVWITEYLLPILLAILILNLESFNFLYALLSVFAVYNLYEIGYIQNDCETIKRENKPTKRLSEDALTLYEKLKILIYAVRIIFALLFSYLLYCLNVNMLFLLTIWLIIPYFMLYNKLRGKINLYMLLLLTGWRYCYPLFIYSTILDTSHILSVVVCVFFAYPVPTFIEICSEGKGNSPEKWTKIFLPDYDGRFIFRIKYYTIMVVVYFVMSICNFIPYFELIIPGYYLLDRIPQLWMKKLGDK